MMNSQKTLIALALIVVCCLPSVFSTYIINCYTCDSVDSCKSPKKESCNPTLGNKTLAYLDLHYDGANMTVVDLSYNCYSDYIKDDKTTTEYKGCIYNNNQACSLGLNQSTHSVNSTDRHCKQCDAEYCNPAGHATHNMLLIGVAVVMAALGGRVVSA